jgi:hypothetical protein
MYSQEIRVNDFFLTERNKYQRNKTFLFFVLPILYFGKQKFKIILYSATKLIYKPKKAHKLKLHKTMLETNKDPAAFQARL